MHRLLVVSFRASPQTGVGIRTPVLASLCEGGVMAFGHDGGRDITRTHPRCSFRRGRCPRSGAKRNKYPWGASPRMPRQRRGIKQKGRSAPRRGVLLPPAAKVPKNAVQTCGLKIPYAPSPVAYLAYFSHANAMPCKFPLNVVSSLLLFSLPLLL